MSYQDYVARQNQKYYQGQTKRKKNIGLSYEEVLAKQSEEFSPDKVAERRQSVADWGERYNATLKGIRDYQTGLGDKYSSDYSGGYLDEIDSLLSDYENIKSYAGRNGMPEILSYIRNLRDLKSSLTQRNAAFDSEEAYNKAINESNWYNTYGGKSSKDLLDILGGLEKNSDEYNWVSGYAGYQDEQEKLAFDVASSRYGISEREKELATFDELTNVYGSYQDFINNGGDPNAIDAETRRRISEYEKLVEKYGSADKLRDQISRDTAYTNLAEQTQKSHELSKVTENDNFAALSGYDSSVLDSAWQDVWNGGDAKSVDMTYEFVNNVGDVRENVLSGWNLSGETERWKALEKMTPEEVAIYNYHYATGGREKAEEYLASIMDSLSSQRAADRFAKYEGKTGKELAFGAVAGLDQFATGMRAVLDGGKSDYIPVSSTQYLSGAIREDLGDVRLNKNKTEGVSFGQGLYDTVTTTANMVPSILASAAAEYVLPGSGGYVGSTLLGTSAGGNAYMEKLNAGYSKQDAAAYGVMIGASEAVMEKVLGGISPLNGGGGLSNAAIKGLSQLDNALARFAQTAGGKILANAGSEALEEAVQSIIEPYIWQAVSGEQTNVDWEEVAYSALLGALTGGLFESGTQAYSSAVRAYVDTKAGAQVKNRSELNNIAESLSKDASPQMQRQLSKEMQNAKNGNNRQVGRLYNTVREIVSERDTADIVKSLTRKGISEDAANKMAGIIVDYMGGKELTDYGKQAFNDILRDKRVQTVVSDLIDNKMSTVGQRNQQLAAATNSEVKKVDVESVKAQQKQEFLDENLEYESNDNGQTISKETGKTVSVVDINDIGKNGKVMVNLEDGSVADADTLSFGSVDTALAYSALKGRPMSASDANTLLKLSEGMDSVEFTEAVEVGYERGYANLTKPEGKVQSAAYEAGKARRLAEGQASNPTTTRKGIKILTKDGRAVDYNEAEKSGGLDAVTKRQKAALKTIEMLDKLELGTSFYIFESYTETINGVERTVFKDEFGKKHEAPNGMYYKDGRIYVDINAGAGRNGRVMLQTVAHELTHHIQAWNAAKYKALADFLAAEYGKRGVDTYSAIKAKQQELSDIRGSTVSFNEAYHEFVADSLSVMFNDGNLYDKLVKLKQTDSVLFNELYEFVSKLAEKVRKLFNNDRTETAEGRFVQSWDTNTIERLQQSFAEALVEASGNYESALNSVAKPDAKPISNNEIITDGVTVTDGVGKQLSVKSMKADIAEGKMFEDLKRVLKWSDAKVNALRTNLTNLVNYMAREEVRGIVDMNESYGREGRRFSPFKPNSDPLYKISLDFSTLCSKRLLTQFVIENLQLRENRPMTAEEQMAIRAMLNEYRKVENGLQVACAMCYVEAARLKSPKQIQRWLENPEPLLRDYFAKKNNEFNDSVKEAQAEFKESRGYDRNATKKDMKGSDIKELNKIGPRMRANYKLSAEESAIVERALKLPEGTYLTAANLATLSESEPVIYNAYSSFVRTATRSKGLETDEPYYYGDSTRDNGNGIIVSDSFIEDVNRENGMRFSSWSDWRIQHMLDYITAVIDMSVRGAAMHGYTKFGDEVRVLGKTGMMFNMSGVAGTQTGLNEDGSLSFSETESIDADEAIQLREEFPDTAGLQCIGVSKEHIIALLASDIIDYVIPYHTSGLNAALRRMADIHGWKDFTGTQNASVDKSIKYEDAVDQEHWHEEPVFSEFFVGYNTGMTGIEAMRQSAENYKRMCRERGMTPKFNEFANEENYWKLLIDRKMINQKTGNLIKQMPVTPEFDFDLIKDIVDNTVTNYDSGMESRALNHIVENWDTIPQRIRDLKKKGTAKAKKTAKAVDTLSNQTLAAMPKEKNAKIENDLHKVQMATRLDPRQVKERDVLDLVERSMYEFDEGTYIPVRATTPPILSYVVWKHTKETFMPQNLPMIMEVGKVRQATEEDDGIVYENNKPHGITPTGMVEIFKQMGDPAYIVYQPNGRYVEIVRYRDRTGHAALASIDLFGLNEKARPINPEYMNGYEGGVYNFVVTTYNPDDLPGYLNDPKNLVLYDKQKGLPERGSGSKLPSHLTDKPFYEDIVPHEEDGVNTEDAQKSDRLTDKQADRTYLDAVSRGDMETVRKMTDQAARKAGYPVKVFHGTQKFGFTKLNVKKSDDGISFFATEDLDVAGSYSGIMVAEGRGINEKKEQMPKTAIPKLRNRVKVATLEFIHEYTTTLGMYNEREMSGIEYYANRDTSEVVTPGEMIQYATAAMDAISATHLNTMAGNKRSGQQIEVSEETQQKLAKISEDYSRKISQIISPYYDAGVYGLYANTDNHLVIDAHGSRWNDIKSDTLPKRAEAWTTRDIAQYAKEQGYSGVTFKNVVDPGNHTVSKAATVYAFFDPQAQVKSADPVTYDAFGKPIPLSKRFNANKNDIRYSDRAKGETAAPADVTKAMQERGEKAIETATTQREAKVSTDRKTHHAVRAALTNRDLIAQIEGKTDLERRKIAEYNKALSDSRKYAESVKDLNRQIKEVEASDDPGKVEKINKLRTDLNKATANKKTLDSKLSRMEDKELEPLVARERVRILDELKKEYGTIPAGERAVRDDSLPTSTDGENFVSRTARTVKGAEATTDEFADLIDTEVAKGRLTYIRITNDEATARAVKQIKKKGWEQAKADWSAEVRSGKASAELSAMGALLLNNAARAGDKKVWLDVLHDYQLMGTNAAQAVQALRILKSLAPSDALYMAERSIESLVDNLKVKTEITISDELKKRYANAKTQEERSKIMDEIQRDVAAQIPSNFLDRWTALRYLNMLGNFRTQIRNIAGNTVMSVTTQIKNGVAATLEAIASVATAGRYQRTKSLFVDKQLRDAAGKDYEIVADIIATGGKYNDANNSNSAFIRGVMENRKIFTKLLAPLEDFRKATNWIMDTGDVWFSKPAYAHALAGYLKQHGVSGGDLSVVSESLLDEARLYAVQEAQEATFHDINAVSAALTARYRGDNKFRKALSVAWEGIMPFRKTPANIAVRAEEYSPLGLINSLVLSAKAMSKNSDVTGAQVINSWAKTLTGSGLFLLGIMLASSGKLIGGPDDDEALDKFQQLAGEQNYALKFGDTYVTIDWASPSAIPLFMGAQLYKLTQDNGFQIKDIESALTSLAEPLVEMSMLQGLNDVLENIQYSDNNLMQMAINAMVAYASQVMTNTMLGQIERAFEDSRSTTYVDRNSALPDWMQMAIGKASAKVPGWDYNQIPYINAWGEEEENPGIAESLAYNMLSPSYISKRGPDAVADELERLHAINASGRAVFPSAPNKKVTFTDKDGEKHKDYALSAEEYVALAKSQGQTQRKIVEEMLASDLYINLPDEYKIKAIQSAYDYARESAQIEVLGRDGFSSKWMGELGDDPTTGLLAHVYDEHGKDMFMSGNLSDSAASEVLQNYSGMTQKESASTLSEWQCERDTGIAYDDIKKAYVSGEITAEEAANLKVKYGGYKDDDARDAVAMWKCEKETGIAYDDIKRSYLDGEITAGKAVSLKVKYGGLDENEAAETIAYWDFQDDYPQYADLSQAAVTGYYEYAKPNNISAKVYYDYYNRASQCDGEKDPKTGKTISGSKKSEILEVIDSLSISKAQKNALYLANGWSEKNLKNAPWN